MTRVILVVLLHISISFTLVAQNNVGIGTTDPEKELDVRGTVLIKRASSANNPHIEVNGSTPGDAFGRIKFASDASGTDNYWMFAGRSFEGNDPASRFNLFYAGDSITGNLFSLLGNGKFGINTTPSDRLHVVADGDENAMRVVVGGATKLRVLNNGGTTIGVNNTGGTPSDGLYVHGNTGLGVSNPVDRLAVNGDVDINGIAKIDGMALGHSNVHPSAILDIATLNAGVLLPRMKTTQRDMIASPAEGLLIYNVDDDQFNIYKNAAWEPLNAELTGDGESSVKLDPGVEDGIVFYKAASERAKIIFKSSDIPVLEFKNSSGNTLIGEDAADGLDPSGSSGIDNVFVGKNAGRFSLTTSHSTYIGRDAGQGNEDGNRNIFIGEAAGKLRQSSTDNVFIGYNAGNNNVNKSNNIFIGNEAGIGTSGAGNIHLGNKTKGFGERCVYIGHQAGEDSGGNDNVVVGYRAGRDSVQQQNTIIGAYAGEIAPSMYDNVLIGYEAGRGSAFYNTLAVNASTMVGCQAGRLNEADYNTFIGYEAGRNHQLGDNCVFIGNQAGIDLQGSNRLVIESNLTTNGLIYGDFSSRELAINWDFGSAIPNTLSVNGNASKSTPGSWLGNSDQRLKKNIKYWAPEEALMKVLAMRGATYEWNDKKTGIERPEGVQMGFIAQDVQEVFPEKVSEDANGYLQTSYGDYDPIFVEAIRALHEKIEAQDAVIRQLLNELKELKETEQSAMTNPNQIGTKQ